MSRTAGHYAPWYLAALLSGLIVLTVVPEWADLVPWPVLAGALLAVLVAAVYLALCVFAHNRRLCERCIGSVPLDASRVASRYGLRFRVAHLFERKAPAIAYLTALLGSAVLSVHPVGRYAWAAAQASLIYLLFVYVTHQRMQPWCPQCRQGGSHQVTPARPNPVSSGL